MGRRTKRPGKSAAAIVRAGGKDGPQIVDNPRGKRWSDDHEARFLDELAVSCNVRRAARAAGFSSVAVYNRRRNDAAFAARWDATLAQGYLNIEMLLVRRATEALEGHIPDPDLPIAPMSAKDAMQLLAMYQASRNGRNGRLNGRLRPRSLDEMRGSIITKLEAIEVARLSGATPPVIVDHEG